MPQFSITTTTTTTTTITTTMATPTHHFSSLLFSYLILFCSFIVSYPLYISYFIFFSPYLLKLFSFLSPLFVTTSLFLLVFLTYHNNSYSQNQESKVGILLNFYQKVLNILGWSLDEENDQNFQLLEGLEACMVVLDDDTQNYLHLVGFKYIALIADEETGEFQEITLKLEEKTGKIQEIVLNAEKEKTGEFKETTLNLEEKTGDFKEVIFNIDEKAGKIKDVAIFIEEQEDEFQDVADIIEVNTVEFQELSLSPPQETGEFSQNNSQAAITMHELSHSATTPELTSKPQLEEIPLTKKQMNNYKEKQSTQPSPPLKNLEEMLITPSVSMRKEKEWKRTLACKLYEERQNSEGSEGMDLLWEEYEADNTGKVKNKNVTEYDGEDDEEEDEEVDVKLCCLQALKMSTGKMNLGMKKPSLVKFSKALKGIGWLHHHVSSKNGRDRVKSA
ncbi:hypothetical protein ACHQM5_028120 [Ranunculus cassubicifolius]